MVHGSPGGSGLGIQSAFPHLSGHGGTDNMRALFSLFASVNQIVLRYLRRIQAGGHRCRRQRSTAFTELVYTGDIDCIFCQILQLSDGITVIFNLLNLLILSRRAFLIIEVIGKGILHILPGHHDTFVFPNGRYIVRLIRLAGGFGRGIHLITVSAGPGTVDGLHAHLIGQIIGQLFPVKAADIQRIFRCKAGFLPVTVSDQYFIPRHIDTGIPA